MLDSLKKTDHGMRIQGIPHDHVIVGNPGGAHDNKR